MRVLAQRQIPLIYYILLLKPRETFLLVFIGMCTAIYVSHGVSPISTYVMLLAGLLSGSAGCNGLTNYLDRQVDEKMERTKRRVLPMKLIDPPEKALPLIIGLIIVGLVVAWFLNPICFIFGLVGVIASTIWRKTVSCTFLGIVAGCAPILIGWYAVNNTFDIRLLLICLLVALWIPVHVWNVMLAKREEYYTAGLFYFPLNINEKTVKTVLLISSIFIYIVSMLMYFISNLNIIFLIVANILGITMITAITFTLLKKDNSLSWRAYKISSFPYLGFIFLALMIDTLLK